MSMHALLAPVLPDIFNGSTCYRTYRKLARIIMNQNINRSKLALQSRREFTNTAISRSNSCPCQASTRPAILQSLSPPLGIKLAMERQVMSE
jgi:hypothetical protein